MTVSAISVLFVKEWSDCNSVARVFQIGKQEASAVSNLMSKVDGKAVKFLTDSVRSRGMLKYMQHEVIGKDTMNTHWTSGFGEKEAWKEEFRNMDDGRLVPWACSSNLTRILAIVIEQISPLYETLDCNLMSFNIINTSPMQPVFQLLCHSWDMY